MLQPLGVTGDVDEATYAQQKLLSELRNHTNQDTQTTVRLSSLITPTFFGFDHGKQDHSGVPYISAVYDQLVTLWISSLPRKTPGVARLAKERLARRIATEICFASAGLSIQENLPPAPDLESSQPLALDLAVRSKVLPYHLPANHSLSQPTSFSTGALPTPAQTPSLSSRASTSAYTETFTPNEHITRLRTYAVSIDDKPALGAGKTRMLFHWPAAPGADPVTYNWEAANAATSEAHGDGGEGSAINRRQELRKRRREERLRRPGTVAGQAAGLGINPLASQPLATTSFAASQQASGPTVGAGGSQGWDQPMTQVERGPFGGRATSQPKKKKRRAAGF